MSFTADLSGWCRKTAPQYADGVVRKTVIEIGSRAVLRSPVGDSSYWQQPAPDGYVGGRFRGNWQHGFGSAPTGNLDAIDPSGGTTLNRITSATISSQAAGITWLVNNLPYSERIENGWSRQAPQGIVNRIELEFPSIFEQAKR
jgi:hypothetical protein